MKIDSIEFFHVRLPLISPFRTAYGEDADVHSVLVKMISGDQYGWGETTPFQGPCYSSEWAGGVFAVIREFLGPRLIGKNVRSAEDLLQELACYKGNQFAKGGVEMAWWALEAKLKKKPLHIVLGGKKQVVRVGADFGVQDSVDILLEKIQQAVDEGYPRVKLKFRRGWDISMLKAVRDSFPNYTFHIDCNSSFSLADLDLFRKVDRFGLAMIEQPLFHTDLVDHATLQKEIETPICLDESITTPKSAEQAIQLGSCRYVNVKIGRVGGLLNAIKIHDICKEASIPCWVGGMLESGVGSGVSIELASLPNFTYPADIFPSKVFYDEDLADPEIKLCGPGKMASSNVPGTPYEPRESMLNRNTVAKAVLWA